MSPKSHINFLADFCSFQKSKSPIDNFHMVTTLVCCLFNARKVRKVVISEKRLQVLNNTFIAPHGLFYSQCSGPWLYAIGPDVSTYSKTVKTRRQKKVANFADAFTLMCSLGLRYRTIFPYKPDPMPSFLRHILRSNLQNLNLF